VGVAAVRKLLLWLLLALVAWRVIADPHGAAAAVRHIGIFFSSIGKG
jgi:hypothetical protein